MGLRPVVGRLLGPEDDGAQAAGAAVLTYRFWSTTLASDPSVVGKTIRLGDRSATIVGIVEPSVPYPAETEIIANVVTSPHHLSATMVTGRVHRMTELFARLAPGVELDAARAELRAVHKAIVTEHPEDYSPKSDFRIDAKRLRDQITSPARTILLVLLAASALVFVIACSNVANLILARSVRREGELAVRAALGASAGALRRTLLAESLVLCGAGAALGVLIARPMVAVLARYASRFSVRALDLTVDASLLWVGVGLALAAAVLLAYVPRLPSADTSNGTGLSTGSSRISTGTNRRLRVFAVTQIAASFVLLAGAGMLLTTLLAMQATRTGFNMRSVLAVNVPIVSYDRSPDQLVAFYNDVMRRVGALPGVERAASARRCRGVTPGRWFQAQFSAEGYVRANGEEDPRAHFRTVSPGFFAALGVPIIAGRDFNEGDRRGSEKVVIVSQSLAQRMFANQDAVNRRVMWTDPVIKFIDVSGEPRRIVGVVADVDDENVVPGPVVTVYHPLEQEIGGGRLFVHTRTDPYSLVAPITQDHPRDVGGAADRAGGHARRRARRGARAGPLEHVRLRRIRGRRAADRGGRRCRRARVLGERADARVRDPAGGRVGAEPFTDEGAQRRRGDRWRGRCRRRHRRLRAGAGCRQLHSRRAAARCSADRAGGVGARGGGHHRVADARGAGVAGRRHPGAAR